MKVGRSRSEHVDPPLVLGGRGRIYLAGLAFAGVGVSACGSAGPSAKTYSDRGKMQDEQCAKASESRVAPLVIGRHWTTRHALSGATCVARELLAELRLPKGAVNVGFVRQLGPSGRELLPAAPACSSVVGVDGYWRVPGGAREAIGWIEAHPPTGVIRHWTGSASGAIRGGVLEWDGGLTVAVKEPHVARKEAVAFEAIEKLAGGGAALRVEAQAAPVGARCPEANY